MPDRTCDVPDCGAPHRAKGLCAKHYAAQSKTPKAPYRTVVVQCGYCDASLERQARSDRPVRFCDLTCRDLWRIDNGGMWRRQASCPVPADHPARWYGTTCAVAYTSCGSCDVVMVCDASWGKKYCSQPCRNRAKAVARTREQRRAKDQARRRRKLIRRVTIFERDSWTCWLCGGATSREYSHADPLSPTVDHVQPGSLGGGDEESNLATAHLICNSRRRNTDQLTWPVPA